MIYLITKTLLAFLSWLVHHDFIIESYSIIITIILTYQWFFDIYWNSPGSKKNLGAKNAEAKLLKIIGFLYIFQFYYRISKLSLVRFFWISNFNRKCWNFWPRLSWNVVLKKAACNIRFTCIEGCFYQLKIKIKPMFSPCKFCFKRIFWDFSEIFCNSSSLTLCQTNTTCEKTIYSKAVFLILLSD